MSIFTRFFSTRLFKRKTEKQETGSNLLSLLADRGISASIEELAEEMDAARQNLKVKSVLPEMLVRSFNGAELAATDGGYCLNVSAGFPQEDLEVPLLLAMSYASVSELARKKGVPRYSLKPGEVIGIHEVSDYDHPIHSVFNIGGEQPC